MGRQVYMPPKEEREAVPSASIGFVHGNSRTTATYVIAIVLDDSQPSRFFVYKNVPEAVRPVGMKPTYVVSVHEGVLSCNCPGFQNRMKCWHHTFAEQILGAWDELADLIRRRSENGHVVIRKEALAEFSDAKHKIERPIPAPKVQPERLEDLLSNV